METSIHKILQVTSDYYGIDQKYVSGKMRFRLISKLRHVYFYLSREFTDESLFEIGNLINRHHSIVLYGANKIRLEKEIYLDLRKDIQEITSKLFEFPIVIKEIDLLRITQNNTN